MEERSTSGDFLSKDSNISAWETTITAPNGSIDTDSLYCSIKFQAIIYLSFVFVLVGMAGNAIVLWLLGFRMHRNAFSVYILNLAMADFLFLCIQFVLCLLIILHIFYSTSVYIPSFSIVMTRFVYLSGLSILGAISVERCLSGLWPIWYRCQRPRHMSAVTCALLWSLSLILTLLHGDACGLLFNSFSLFWCQILDYLTALWLIVLFVVLCVSSLTLLVKIFCGSQRIPVTRPFVIIILTVLFFLIFGLPLGIYWILYIWFLYLYYFKNCYLHVTVLLSCVNSCANPIIYFFVGSIRHGRFQRKTLELLLQRALQDTPEEKEGGERGSSGEPGERRTL